MGGSHVEPIAAEGKGTGSHFVIKTQSPADGYDSALSSTPFSYGAGVRRAGSDSRLTLLYDIKEV